MTRDFFDPTPEQQNVVLIGAATASVPTMQCSGEREDACAVGSRSRLSHAVFQKERTTFAMKSLAWTIQVLRNAAVAFTSPAAK
jgi:hypothetical protein